MLPRIEYRNGQPRLLVDERPFLILGLQWDCDSCFSPAEMNPLFPHAARLGANTVVLPTYWREIEPEPGHFTFAMVDERLRQARAYGLRLILLWFATWKNASPFYAPDDVRNDPVAYPRVLDRNGQPTISLCPSAETTWARDCAALVALFRHLREVDDQHTVIMVQIENEPGILGSDRCYCPTCSQRFIQECWADRWGSGAPEAFSAVSIARYIDRLAGETKAIYPLPVYFNVWLAPAVGGIPGRDYPAGGAVPDVLDLVRQELHHVDLVAPDIYTTGVRDFHRLCQVYRAGGNPLYIAEHSSSPDGRADRNVFYAIGQYGALGFDPWAIDASFPERQAPPLVDPIGGEWGPQAFRLRDSYVAIARAIEPIVDAQGTDRIFVCVQEESEMQTGWIAKGCDILINYDDRDRAGRGLIIQRDTNEFLLIGVGFTARFRRPRPDGRPIPVRHAEWGYFERNSWHSLHPIRREQPEVRGMPIALREPGVARVVLDL
jgi:hypothetical protein